MERKVVSIRVGDGSIKIPARLSREQWTRFRAAAEREGRSITSQISWLIRRYLGEAEPRIAKAGGAGGASVVRERGPLRLVPMEDTGADLAHWLGKTPAERVAAVEFLREQYYALLDYKNLPRLARSIRLRSGR